MSNGENSFLFIGFWAHPRAHPGASKAAMPYTAMVDISRHSHGRCKALQGASRRIQGRIQRLFQAFPVLLDSRKSPSMNPHSSIMDKGHVYSQNLVEI